MRIKKTTSQILLEARQRLAAGWCQFAYHRRRTPGLTRQYCLMGSLGRHRTHVGVRAALARALGQETFSEWEAWVFNDTEDRTQEEVVALLDAALETVTK